MGKRPDPKKVKYRTPEKKAQDKAGKKAEDSVNESLYVDGIATTPSMVQDYEDAKVIAREKAIEKAKKLGTRDTGPKRALGRKKKTTKKPHEIVTAMALGI